MCCPSKSSLAFALTLLLLAVVAGCTSPDGGGGPATTAGGARTPTLDDGVSPSYRPDTPVRSVVGSGHVLTGTVVSSRDGSPIEGARLELWPEYAGLGHPDEARATVFTDASGAYRFECDPPEHIHMRITAEGYLTIGQNSYHPEGRATGEIDIVLRPE